MFRHDCKTHVLSNGDTVMVDGGNSFADGGYYGRGTLFKVPDGTLVEDYSLTEKSTFEEICDKLLWGTTGKFGDEPLRFMCLADCELEHLKAMLKTQNTMNPLHRSVAQYWMLKKTQEAKF